MSLSCITADKEHYRYPSPYLQKVCRKLAEKGAGLAVCQHSHCIGCKEEWMGARIVYGQGNFLFDRNDNEFWNTSLLIELSLEKRVDKVSARVNCTPIVNCKNVVRAATEQNRRYFAAFMRARKKCVNRARLKKNTRSLQHQCLTTICARLPPNRRAASLYRAINRLSGRRFSPWYLSLKYSPQDRLCLRNFIECDAHRELLLKGLEGIQD